MMIITVLSGRKCWVCVRMTMMTMMMIATDQHTMCVAMPAQTVESRTWTTTVVTIHMMEMLQQETPMMVLDTTTTTMGIAATIGTIAVIPGVSIITVADAVTTTA